MNHAKLEKQSQKKLDREYRRALARKEKRTMKPFTPTDRARLLDFQIRQHEEQIAANRKVLAAARGSNELLPALSKVARLEDELGILAAVRDEIEGDGTNG